MFDSWVCVHSNTWKWNSGGTPGESLRVEDWDSHCTRLYHQAVHSWGGFHVIKSSLLDVKLVLKFSAYVVVVLLHHLCGQLL